MGRKIWHAIRYQVLPLAAIALVVFACRSSLADWYNVPSGSMRPTILEGDKLFVSKLAYGLRIPFTSIELVHWRDPAAGDIVVFRHPDPSEQGKMMVKRVVAVPGDTVEMERGDLFVNKELVFARPYHGSNFLEPKDRKPGEVLFVEQIQGAEHWLFLSESDPRHRKFGPETVPPGHFFMLGDNRDNSRDSRAWGYVPMRNLRGKVVSVMWSWRPGRWCYFRGGRFFRGMR